MQLYSPESFLCSLGHIVLIFAIAVYHNVHAELDFIVRKPGAEKKDDDPEAPADEQIVDMVNESAACWAIDVAQQFTIEDVKAASERGPGMVSYV